MKFLSVVTLAVATLSASAMASGKLGLGVTLDTKAKEAAPVIGLSIYENIKGPVFYSQWTGFGCEQSEFTEKSSFCDTRWASTKHGLDAYVGPVQLGLWAGAEVDAKSFDLDTVRPLVGAKVALQLWK
jgi:hypothetical protein